MVRVHALTAVARHAHRLPMSGRSACQSSRNAPHCQRRADAAHVGNRVTSWPDVALPDPALALFDGACAQPISINAGCGQLCGKLDSRHSGSPSVVNAQRICMFDTSSPARTRSRMACARSCSGVQWLRKVMRTSPPTAAARQPHRRQRTQLHQQSLRTAPEAPSPARDTFAPQAGRTC